MQALPAEVVYAGLSLGVPPAQQLAQTRAHAKGALLLHACVPASEFGAWPRRLPVQVHAMDADPFFVEDGDVEAARALVEEVESGELFLYPGDQHLFVDTSLTGYDPEAAALLHRRRDRRGAPCYRDAPREDQQVTRTDGRAWHREAATSANRRSAVDNPHNTTSRSRSATPVGATPADGWLRLAPPPVSAGRCDTRAMPAVTPPVFGTCPCGSGTAYGACCKPLHDGEAADTAEALMRSRYAAYAVGHLDYVSRTWDRRTRPGDLSPAPGTVWEGLDILRTVRGGPLDDTGLVEFRARFRTPAGQQVLHETSRFERRLGRWTYLDGEADVHTPRE